MAEHAPAHKHIRALDDLRPGMLEEVEAFFAQYNARGRGIPAEGRGGADAALALVRDGMKASADGTS